MVDINLSNEEEVSLDENWIFDKATYTESAYLSFRNLIGLKFDLTLCQFTLSFKALALNAGAGNCGADTVRAFLS